MIVIITLNGILITFTGFLLIGQKYVLREDPIVFCEFIVYSLRTIKIFSLTWWEAEMALNIITNKAVMSKYRGLPNGMSQ